MKKSLTYTIYSYDKSEITTIEDFLNDPLSIVKSWTKKELLAFKDSDGETNLIKIYREYSPEEKEEYSNDFKAGTLSLIKVTTLLALDNSKLNRDLLYQLSSFTVKEGTYIEFFVNQLRRFEDDPKYRPVQKQTLSTLGIVRDIFPKLTVWLWCRSLSKIINLSPFIESISTNTTDMGGSFQMSLAPIIGEYIEDQGWTIKDKNFTKYNRSEFNFSASGDISKKNISIEEVSRRRSDFYFHNIINENDIIFIRYETLENEIKQRINDNRDFEVGKEDLPGRIYDMIGLVDSNSINVNPATANVQINISGRDLIKLVIDDGCYFYPLEFMPGGMFANEQKESRDLVHRINGKLVSLSQYSIRSLEFIMKFIINALANIGICPQETFDAYGHIPTDDIDDYYVRNTLSEYEKELLEKKGDMKSKFFQLTDEANKELNAKNNELNKVKEDILNEINNSRKSDNVDNISIPSLNVMNELLRFIKEAKKQGKTRESANQLIGWDGGWKYKEIEVKEDTYPDLFNDNLYQPLILWFTKKTEILRTRTGSKIDVRDKALNDLLVQAAKETQEEQNSPTNNNSELPQLPITQSDQTQVDLSNVNNQIDQQARNSTYNFKKRSDLIDFYKMLAANTKKYPGKYIESSETTKKTVKLINQQKWGGKYIIRGIYKAITGTDINTYLKKRYTKNKLANEPGMKELVGEIIEQSWKVINPQKPYIKKPYLRCENSQEIKATLKALKDAIYNSLLPKSYLDLKEYKQISYSIESPTTFQNINKYGNQSTKDAYKYIKLEEAKNNFQGETEEKPMKGIWQIVKLLIDDNVRDRRVVDSTIGNEMGSILNPIKKICQKPFVEFFTDTYGDQFYYIVRTVPFDLKRYSALKDVALNITGSDVISEQLSFNQGDIYSWYRITPQGLISGQGNDIVWAYLKAVHFKKYMDIWGDKPLDIITNYIPYEPKVGDKDGRTTANFVKQAIYDLKFLVDTHAYMPFVRTGTITINPDRRIKRGTVIRYQPTGEVFYVESVNQSYQVNNGSIDRQTTLQVTRGMVEKHFSLYFQIINTKIDESKFTEQNQKELNWTSNVMQNWKVNDDVFNFFLRRQQFSQQPFIDEKIKQENQRYNEMGI